jgi:hypothetical protein
MDPSTASPAMPAIRNPFNLVAQYQNGKFTPVKVGDPGTAPTSTSRAT